jgi:hypothetical protein
VLEDAEEGRENRVGGKWCISLMRNSLLGNFNLFLDEYNLKYIEEVNRN